MEIASVDAVPLVHDLPDGAGYGSARGIATARSATLVRLETRDGLVGWGEAAGPGRTVATLIDEVLTDRLVGRDPFDAPGLHEELATGAYHVASGAVVRAGLSGADIACWDLRGKATGRPVRDLLDGPSRDSVTPYASTMYFYADDRDPASGLRAALDEGFRAFKIKIGRSIAEDEERVALARETVGDEALLMVDSNGNYRPDQAIRSARAIERFDPTWYEEPVPPGDPAGYREVREAVDVPLAGSEALATTDGFDRLLDRRAVDVVQPNLCLCGGFTAASRIAARAAGANAAVRPFNWFGAVGVTAGLQFAATVPGYPHAENVPEPVLVEFDRGKNPLRDDLLVEPLDPGGDEIPVPDGPGLGVEVDEDAVERYRLA